MTRVVPLFLVLARMSDRCQFLLLTLPGSHTFVPCLYEDIKERTFFLGVNTATLPYSKEISCPYCVSCKMLKAPKGFSDAGSPQFGEMQVDVCNAV